MLATKKMAADAMIGRQRLVLPFCRW